MLTSNHTTTATVTCICGTEIPAEGKHIHLCIQRHGRKVVSREYVGFYDGQPISYGKHYNEAQVNLDAYAYDLLSETAAVTADNEAKRSADWEYAHAPASEPDDDWPLTTEDDDDYGDALAEQAMGSYNGRTDIDPPAEPDPGPEPWPTCPGAFSPDIPCGQPATVAGDFCLRCAAVLERIAAEALEQPESYFVDATAEQCRAASAYTLANQRYHQARARLDVVRRAVRSALPCKACGGQHHIQQCEAVRALLFAPIAIEVAA